jgi:hypothetical protein
MALTIIKQPDDYAYSGNPITLELVPSSIFTDNITGTLMQVSIDVSTTDALAGNTVTFSFNNQSITYTCTDTYVDDDAANTFPSRSGVAIATWKISLVSAFSKNFFFVRNFKLISLVADIITLECLVPTTDFDITTNIAAATVAIVTAGVLPSVPDNYEIICDIESQFTTDSTTTRDTIAVKPATVAPYHAMFFLEKILDARLKPTLPSATTPHQNVTQFRQFFLRFAEKYGNPAQEHKTYVSEPSWVIKGNTEWLFLQQVPGYDLSDYLLSFLTNQPLEKNISIEQPEYLYFFNKAFTGAKRLHVQVFWDDGTDTQHSVATITLDSNQLWVLPCGWSDLGIANGTLQPLKWRVSLSTYSGSSWASYYSNIQTFTLDNQCDGRYLIFQNNRGGMDTVRIKEDKTIQNLKVEKESLKRIWRKDPFAATEVYRKSTTEIFKVQSGIINTEHAKWFAEIFDSKYVWEIDPLGIYIPILINTDSVQITDGSTDLQNIIFEYQHAID